MMLLIEHCTVLLFFTIYIPSNLIIIQCPKKDGVVHLEEKLPFGKEHRIMTCEFALGYYAGDMGIILTSFYI